MKKIEKIIYQYLANRTIEILHKTKDEKIFEIILNMGFYLNDISIEKGIYLD